jgi:transposase
MASCSSPMSSSSGSHADRWRRRRHGQSRFAQGRRGPQGNRNRGAKLLYLPSYSPDLNPIEQAFAKLKALLRAKALRTVEALWNALGDIVACFSPAECANFLRHAGYF